MKSFDLKSEKIGVTKAVSSVLQFFCLLPLSFFFFSSTGTRKGTNMFNGPANFRTFHQRKRNKSCSKYLYFLSRKSLRNGIGLRQDLYMSNLNTVE